MKKVLLWAVGVPFLVLGMVLVSYSDGGGGSVMPGHTVSRTT